MRTFGPKRDEVTGGWRTLHNVELLNLYSSPSTIRMIKSRRMRWVVHVARIGEKRNLCRMLMGKPEGKNHWEDQNVGGWAILKWIFERYDGMDWIDVAQDRDQWAAVVNTVLNLRVL
jgi:hypothetical protein